MTAPATEAALLALRDAIARDVFVAIHGNSESHPGCVDAATRWAFASADAFVARLRAATPAPEPACVHCGHARHPRWCEADECSCATGYEFDPPADPAAAATGAEAVGCVYLRKDACGIWSLHEHPVPGHKPFYPAAQLAAAEARGRASAEARIAALREAMVRAMGTTKSDEVLSDAMRADDVAKEAGK